MSKFKISKGVIMSRKRNFIFSLTCGFVFYFVPQINAQLLKGPYLIYSGINTEMNVLWQTDNHDDCEISWGLDQSCSTGKAQTHLKSEHNQHKFKITGLTPGSKYYYRVSQGQDSYAGSFRAAPDSEANSVEFLVYGDTRTNPDRQDEVCRNILATLAENPDYQTFILHVGDWASGNTDKDWAAEFFNRTYSNNISMQANLPIAGCRGNHETRKGIAFEEYWPYPYKAGGLYWSFDYGPAHIAIIDQYTNYSSGSAQLEWLTQDLINSTKKWKFILLHEPGWSAGSSNKDVQAHIQPLCEKYGVQVVFSGHKHYYSRAIVQGVQHLTIGTGGAPFRSPKSIKSKLAAFKTNTLGYARISIFGNTLNYEMLRSPDNTVIDTFTIQR
jgi:predicted phosphodiesterase